MPATVSREPHVSPLGLERGISLTLHDRHGSRAIAWDAVGELEWSDFALVLGAGGATGLSFEAGCLLALATDHRVRVGDATALVGTSAGSIAASLIALGFDALDLAAVVSEVHHYVDPALAAMQVRMEGELPALPGLVHLLRRPTVGSAVTGMGLVLRRRFTAALANAIRHGDFDLAPQLRFLEDVAWPEPEGRLRVCATQAANGRRSVLSSRSGVPLIDAVAASCAVPGVMRPVTVEGQLHLDGGLVSPTNADVLESSQHGAVVVISPMSGRHSTTAVGRVSSAHARRRLAWELKRLRLRQPVFVIEPAHDLSALVVDDAFDTQRTRPILTASYLGASQQP